MSPQEKSDFILKLDDSLLVGGVLLSEWSTFLIRDADNAFCAGANLAAILAAQAAIESHLRFEYGLASIQKISGFYELIESSPISDELRQSLHRLRKYRNRWVHIDDPSEDADLLTKPEYYESEMEEMAIFAIAIMREVIYSEQWI